MQASRKLFAETRVSLDYRRPRRPWEGNEGIWRQNSGSDRWRDRYGPRAGLSAG